MTRFDFVAISYFVTFILLTVTFQASITVSSTECNANIFYDFLYCVSSSSQCAQCIPCYNDDDHDHGELYIPMGTDYAKPCTKPEAICVECKAICQETFNHQHYDEYVKNSDPTCPTLSNFISEMDVQTISNLTIPYEFNCNNNDTIAIKYAIVSSNDGYKDRDKQDCTLDFSHQIIAQCDEQTSCKFNINTLLNQLNCARSSAFRAEIGAFCISAHDKPYNGLQFIQPDVNNNDSDPTKKETMYIIIIAVLATCVVICVVIIICQCKGNKYKHPASDSPRLANKSNNKKARTVRAQSDTIERDNNNTTDGSTAMATHHHIPYPQPHVQQQQHQQQQQQQRVTHNKRGYITANNQYQNMKHRPLPVLAYSRSNKPTQFNQPMAGNGAENRGAQPDAMIVAFQGALHNDNNNNNVSHTPQTQSVSYNHHNGHYGPPHITTTDRARNSSVIVDPMLTQTRNTPFSSFSAVPAPQHRAALRNGYMTTSSHAANAHLTPITTMYDYGMPLNQSDVIYPFQPHTATGTDELQHTLMNFDVNDQKLNTDYTNYWNQYYGINSQPPLQMQPHPQQMYINYYDAAEYPDFANPNGDHYDDSQIRIIGHHEIQYDTEIGKGSSSKVFKARWQDKEVAAKRFTVLNIDSKKSKEYISKYLLLLKKEPHMNVIRTLAIANKPFTLLTEYMNRGSVKNYVRRSRPGSTSISILDRIEITLQAAKGLQHLHKLGIIHAEITCQNLLMETLSNRVRGSHYNISDIRVVITDYAIQQILTGDELETYRSSLGPLKWMSPELIEDSNAMSCASDIYAFGITMWEIITGQEPYPDVDPVDTAIHVLVKERRPQSYAFIPEKIQNLMKLCWHKNVEERPKAAQVVGKLAQFIQIERKQHDLE